MFNRFISIVFYLPAVSRILAVRKYVDCVDKSDI